jgi:uncharacterized Rossmann fold enzyme
MLRTTFGDNMMRTHTLSGFLNENVGKLQMKIVSVHSYIGFTDKTKEKNRIIDEDR